MYIDWDENYGRTFKLVYTPEGRQSGEWSPNLVSVVTPENGDAWTDWVELENVDSWKENWDNVQKSLADHKYNQIIRGIIKLDNLKENINRIRVMMGLNENDITSLSRRLYVIDDWVNYKLSPYRNYPRFRGAEDLSDYIKSTIVAKIYLDYFDHLEFEEDWEKIKKMIEDYIDSEHGETIRDYFKNHVQKKNQL
jgi:hypothetical protein